MAGDLNQRVAADKWAAGATEQPLLLADALEKLERLNQVQTARMPRWLKTMAGHPITPPRVAALRRT